MTRTARVAGSVVTGWILLFGALVLAVLVVIGLYRWDVGTREAEAALRPAPVAPLALVSETPVLPIAALSPVAVSTTPLPAGADVATGQQIFATTCNSCHPNANAGIGPALHGAAFASRYPDDATLIGVVRQGKGGMPSFAPDQLSDQNLARMVAYLRSLGTSEPAPEPTPTPRPRQRGG